MATPAQPLPREMVEVKNGLKRADNPMRIEYLYRYPVKGLTAEALEEAPVEPGGCIPWDRAFALAQGDSGFDPEQPTWLPKANFMCTMKNAAIVRIAASFDPSRGTLALVSKDGPALTADALEAAGRAKIETFLTDFLGPEARGVPHFHYVPGHVFCDQKKPVLSFINLASLADFERRVGRPRERLRFRANIYFEGADPWVERAWVGRELDVGGARVRVVKPISRCPATEVNLETGVRDANPVQELRAFYGDQMFGFHAEVLAGGRVALGDTIALLPA